MGIIISKIPKIYRFKMTLNKNGAEEGGCHHVIIRDMVLFGPFRLRVQTVTKYNIENSQIISSLYFCIKIIQKIIDCSLSGRG